MAEKNVSIVDDWLEDDKLMLLESWARDGYTLQDIADKIGVTRSTLGRWRDKYKEIAKAIDTGKEFIDYKVENALLKSALGFTTKEIKVTVGRQIKDGKTFEITKETTVREIAPNVTACMAWLNNRRPDKWKRNRDKVLELEDEDSNLTVKIVRGPSNEDENINQEILIRPKTKEEIEADKFENKTPKELYKICKSKGIECLQKKDKEYYLKLLNK